MSSATEFCRDSKRTTGARRPTNRISRGRIVRLHLIDRLSEGRTQTHKTSRCRTPREALSPHLSSPAVDEIKLWTRSKMSRLKPEYSRYIRDEARYLAEDSREGGWEE